MSCGFLIIFFFHPSLHQPVTENELHAVRIFDWPTINLTITWPNVLFSQMHDYSKIEKKIIESKKHIFFIPVDCGVKLENRKNPSICIQSNSEVKRAHNTVLKMKQIASFLEFIKITNNPGGKTGKCSFHWYYLQNVSFHANGSNFHIRTPNEQTNILFYSVLTLISFGPTESMKIIETQQNRQFSMRLSFEVVIYSFKFKFTESRKRFFAIFFFSISTFFSLFAWFVFSN